MQNPPPGPPPGGQPPSYPPPGGQPPGYQPPGYQPPAASGIDKKTGVVLSYLLWFVTGIIFLFLGKDDPDVKYHAAQSTIFFGAITVIALVLWALAGAIGLFGFFAFLVWLFGVVVQVMCIIQAINGNGERFPIPWVGGVITPYAEQLANAIN